ncbi:class I SAM-dependent methyltransferase [Streptomyces sp. NPDC021093]|uniref:class I SAM-dependent methyltransferase n=1 Tax=Streptomyces sp. NPDC021093 TaxID=3365112 RepID=UPI0037AA5A92
MDHIVRKGYEGTGPGAITPDGCAVELYRRLPVFDEPKWLALAAPSRPGARLLELGAGVGRLTRPLNEQGFIVTAVDESAEMLAEVREWLPRVRVVRSPIESLDLPGERYDVVVLMSFLVHAGAEGLREGFLRTCRRHVADDGVVVIQREAAGRHEGLPVERQYPDGGLVRIVSSEPAAGEGRPGTRSVHVQYEFPDAHWTQTFLSCPLTEQEFETALEEAGLKVDAYLDPERTWVRAVPVGARPA